MPKTVTYNPYNPPPTAPWYVPQVDSHPPTFQNPVQYNPTETRSWTEYYGANKLEDVFNTTAAMKRYAQAQSFTAPKAQSLQVPNFDKVYREMPEVKKPYYDFTKSGITPGVVKAAQNANWKPSTEYPIGVDPDTGIKNIGSYYTTKGGQQPLPVSDFKVYAKIPTTTPETKGIILYGNGGSTRYSGSGYAYYGGGGGGGYSYSQNKPSWYMNMMAWSGVNG